MSPHTKQPHSSLALVTALAVLAIPVAPAADFLIDFGGDEGNGAGAPGEPWTSIDVLNQDETVELGGGVTITALDDGFGPNNRGAPNEGAEYDGVMVPVEVRDDYFFKNTDAAGSEARMRIDGLPAGTYNVTVFEGRTTDADQFAKIWSGEEPAEANTESFAAASSTVEVSVSDGEPLWYKHLEDNSGGISGIIIRQTNSGPALESFLIDFGSDEGNGAGAPGAPWSSIDVLNQDETVELGGGVTITALDDGFGPNNRGAPEEGAEYDTVIVPQEVRDDYFFKNTDAAGSEARMRIDGLPAGTYNVTVFEGRTTDADQFAKIWSGEEPTEANTESFAGGSATVEVSVSKGEPLWYKHLEDNSGGISGIIIRQTSSGPPLETFLVDFGSDEGNGAGAPGAPWTSIDVLNQDETVELGGGVTITALDDGFGPNNRGAPEEGAEYDTVIVPKEARDDYFFKNTDAAGSEARMRFDGLSAGTYSVTVFEGRTTDADQFAKIWSGEEPAEANTESFAGGSATVEVNVSDGEPLWYKHLEDNSGGISGIIIRQTSRVGGIIKLLIVSRITRSSQEGLRFEIQYSSQSVLDKESVVLTVDGVEVVPTITDTEDGALIAFDPTEGWDPGTTHTYSLAAKDMNGNEATRSGEGAFVLDTTLMPFNTPLVGPDGLEGMWGVRYVWGAGNTDDIDTAVAVLQASDNADFEGRVFDTFAEVVNDLDGGIFLEPLQPLPEEVELDEDLLWTGRDFIVSHRGHLIITEPGEYTFGVHSADGFGLRIYGVEFGEEAGRAQVDALSPDTYGFRGVTDDSNSRAVVNFPEAGTYPIEFFWYDAVGGGKHGELYFAKGKFLADEDTEIGNVEAGQWELVGTDHLAAGPALPFEILSVNVGASEHTFDFVTLDANAIHVLQHSVNLMDWEADDSAALKDLGEGQFRFTAAASEDALLHYRVGIFPPPPAYADDFESGAEGWTAETAAGDTQWELGTPNAGTLTAAASGDNAWGTNLAGDYTPDSVTSLRSPVIDLTEVKRPKLIFQYFVDAVQDAEGGQLRILNEAGEPIFARDEIFAGTTETWTPFEFTFPLEIRNQKIILEFRLLTDGDGEVGAGWYIDDVVIK
ncbi:PA14 domain-containing protein [Verrucomicrobiales bacterium]|nr:PA14 domain-containing protein [Verrucomicrobiales bacterium]